MSMAPNIGDLLRALGLVTAEQLQRAAQIQREQRPNERIGTLLIEQGAVTRGSLQTCLDKQTRLRSGAIPSYQDTIALADYVARLLEGREKV